MEKVVFKLRSKGGLGNCKGWSVEAAAGTACAKVLQQ